MEYFGFSRIYMYQGLLTGEKGGKSALKIEWTEIFPRVTWRGEW
jgi:hypothetical protein